MGSQWVNGATLSEVRVNAKDFDKYGQLVTLTIRDCFTVSDHMDCLCVAGGMAPRPDKTAIDAAIEHIDLAEVCAILEPRPLLGSW